jgi:hypothetical protein
METLGVRHKKEEIENDKKAKLERRQAKEDRKAKEQTAAMDIAEFENRMAVDDIAQEAMFPRHQSKGM